MTNDDFIVPSLSTLSKRTNAKSYEWSTPVAKMAPSSQYRRKDSIVDMTSQLRDISLRDGVFEAALATKAIPEGGSTLWRTGYVIKIVLLSPSGGQTAVVAEFKLPQYVRPETVTVEHDPMGDHFRIQAKVVNCISSGKRKKPSRRLRVPELLPELEDEKVKPKRCRSVSNMRRLTFFSGEKGRHNMSDIVLTIIRDGNSGYGESSGSRTIARTLSIPNCMTSYAANPCTSADVKLSKVKRHNSMFSWLPRAVTTSGTRSTSQMTSTVASSDRSAPEGGQRAREGSRARLKRSQSVGALLSKFSTRPRVTQLTTDILEGSEM